MKVLLKEHVSKTVPSSIMGKCVVMMVGGTITNVTSDSKTV